MSDSFLLEAWLARQVLLQTVLWRACLPLINHMLRITNKNQGTRISSRLVQRGSQYLIHFEDAIFYSLARPRNVVCVCSMWFFCWEKECWKPVMWMCWGSRWANTALTEDSFESCSWDATLQKLLWEKHSDKELLGTKMCPFQLWGCEWEG